MTAWRWGPEILPGDGARFRLWAPGESAVGLRLGGEDRPMERAEGGWFEITEADATAGADYCFVLGNGQCVPDPAARAQSGDVHGLSRLVDPGAYQWKDAGWRGRPWEEAVICEIHIGTFTAEGTFRAAIERLDHLVRTGFTCIEIMPVAQFAGNRGWGYDGVMLYAPHSAYGSPDDLRALVDAAHARGLMVLLDVVYNHFGPDGNYLGSYAPDFFDAERQTPWGSAIAYHRAPVRSFFVENALYWLEEFHFDGFRFDAIDQVRDPDAEKEVLVEIAERIRATDFGQRIHLTTEDNRNITMLHERGKGGEVTHFTAEWNDDFHNVAHVIAAGEAEGYYADFTADRWRMLARTLTEGFAYQGEKTSQGEPRGEPSGHLPPVAFVDFLQNHDQTGNRAFGERLIALAQHARLRALTTILLLSPHVPLMFMGEEWGETRPFAFFTDFHGELADAVREGRRREFGTFAAFEDPAMRAAIPDPNAEATFASSKIDWAHRDSEEGRDWLAFTAHLLAIRHGEIVPRLAQAGGQAGRILVAEDGLVAVDWQLGNAVLRLRANLGEALLAAPAAEGETLFLCGDWTEEGPMPPDTVLVTIDTQGGASA